MLALLLFSLVLSCYSRAVCCSFAGYFMVLFVLLMLLVLFLFYSLVLLPLELTLRLLVSGLFSVYSLNNSISRSSFTNPKLTQN
jgi:hypothetical protein